jgi:dolichol-phosphate mannosyltransferase
MERTMTKIHVVLPAYNESESLPSLLTRFSELPVEQRSAMSIHVINDGSADNTREVALQPYPGLDVDVIDHGQNMGLGQAVQTGIRTVTEMASDDDLMVLMDADDTHDPELVSVLVAEIQKGADIAIASRFVPGGDDSTAPFFRRLLSRGAAYIFRAALPVDKKVRDFTSGFRAYRVSVLKRAVTHWGERLIEERGFACMVELLMKLRYCKPAIAEVPMYLEYDRKQGASKIRIVRTIFQYLKLAIRDRLSPPPYREI